MRKDDLDALGLKPPYSIELEKAVIGALLLELGAVDRVTMIQPKMMYKEENQLILEAILSMHSENKPIDLLTVGERLERNGKLELAGGYFYISEISLMVTSSANVEYHAAILYEMYVKREIIRICGEKIRLMYMKESDGFLEKQNLVNELELLTISQKKDFKGFNDIAHVNLKKLKELQNSGSTITGIDTGYSKINRLTCGWQKTDLIIIAARPATGKTAFALNIAEKVAAQNIPVAIFSLEMSSEQLVNRVISKVTNIPSYKIKSASLSEGDWHVLENHNYKYPILIDDTPGLNITEFKAKARKAKKEYGIELIIVDYLQLMTTYTKGNRDLQIGDLSRNLKAIAKELNVPVIALSQLSRDVEKTNRMPKLSDLRESGNIEQDADIVAFLHNNGGPTDDVFDISLLFAKHRGGDVGIVAFDFYKIKQSFSEKSSNDNESYMQSGSNFTF
jgi:replicative DNA helicase